MKRLVIALVVLLIVLHQDFWWWDRVDPLVFGFMPIGLAWHVLISIAASFVWYLVSKYCWPSGVDVADHEAAAPRQQRGEL